MNVTTSKTKVSEILDENHIILLPEESVIQTLKVNYRIIKQLKYPKMNNKLLK